MIAKSEMVFEAQTRVPGNEDKKLAPKESFHGVGLKVVADDEAVRHFMYIFYYTQQNSYNLSWMSQLWNYSVATTKLE